MSPLTKVFVMLLVISSLLTASAAVVYVNKEDFSDQAKKANAAMLVTATRERDVAMQDLAAARGRLANQEQLAAKEAADNRAAVAKADADVAAKDAQVQQLMRANEIQEANVTGLNAQLAIALETGKKAADTINSLRDNSEKMVQSQAETETALARQRELADTYGRQVEYLTEQLKKERDRTAALGATMKDHGQSLPDDATTAAGTSIGAPPVSGTVSHKEVINGVTYLTISVGAADNVRQGMEFQVVDNKSTPQKFLGILTITQTDSNTSIGRLQADDTMVAEVKEGNFVTTHLQ